jgi:hypothetical protein
MVRTMSTLEGPRLGTSLSPRGQYPRPYRPYATTSTTISTSTSAASEGSSTARRTMGEEGGERDEHRSVTDLRRFAEGDQVIGTREGFDDTPLSYPLPPERLEGGSATD